MSEQSRATIEFRGSEVKNFFDYCLLQNVSDDDAVELVEDFIDLWHGEGGFGLSLSEALGMSDYDYIQFRSDVRHVKTVLQEKRRERLRSFGIAS
ncbi:MAG: hypothetical protein EOP06_11530 [Proteobacteria bacterium]|nr:MAG: hypothetical protein EOP06_11530 [Pseudomonadota bacterium]